jgi:predicted DNA-binding transcriptional regulator YafY
MTRTARLLALLQLLRRHRRAVSGGAIASELGISLRTLYRDIATLQQQGAAIEGSPGLGYVLKPGFTLPPLMFTTEEVEALALGSRWVAERGDERLAAAARDALAKISAVLPGDLRHDMDSTALLVGPAGPTTDGEENAVLLAIRQAIRAEHKLEVAYRDASNRSSSRTIWPFALGFFDRARVVVAWCELRQDIRHFRTDRIDKAAPTGARYPRRRDDLIKQWRLAEGIAPP